MSTVQKPWYETAFEAEYLAVYAHRDLASARREAHWLIEHGVGGTTLDLCCGFGRHSLALLERGVHVYGLDLSVDLLASTHQLSGGARLAGRLVRGDVRRLPFATNGFESLVNLFSSFGYFGADGDEQVLDEIARVLRPGGRLVMDLMNPARIRDHLVPESHTEGEGFLLWETRQLLDEGRRVTKHVRMVNAAGLEKSWFEDVRLYEPEHMQVLLAERGIEIESVMGGFEGEAFTPSALRQLLIARSR